MSPADVLRLATQDAPRCQEDEDALNISHSVLGVLARYSIEDLKLMAQQSLPEHVTKLISELAACFEEPLLTSNELTLKLILVVKVEPRVRSSKDGRVWVKRATGEYRGSDGEIYRKGFERVGLDPIVPETGTHESMAALRYQWRTR